MIKIKITVRRSGQWLLEERRNRVIVGEYLIN